MTRATLIGVGAALCTIIVWALWIVGTRHAVAGALDPATVSMLRFMVPAIVLAPFWWRAGLIPAGQTGALALCVLGAGLPFFFVVASAMQFAPAAELGPLLPGTMPLFTALLAVVIERERITGVRLVGYALIVVAVLAIGGNEILFSKAGAWRGHLLALLGTFLWAIYTIAYRRSRLGAIETAALIGIWSSILCLPFGAPALYAAIAAGHGREVLLQAILQGGLTGVLALITFGVAVNRLGASRAAAFGALAPPLAALMAIPLLGEIPDRAAVIGIVAAMLGVALASGALGWPKRV